MKYIVFNKHTGEIHNYGVSSAGYVLPDFMRADFDVIADVQGSHDYYVDVGTKLLVQKPPRPEGVATFNYHTKQWDVDMVESIRMARANEYPQIGDQLDALWKGGESLEQMRQQVLAVKEKYPKEAINDTN